MENSLNWKVGDLLVGKHPPHKIVQIKKIEKSIFVTGGIWYGFGKGVGTSIEVAAANWTKISKKNREMARLLYVKR